MVGEIVTGIGMASGAAGLIKQILDTNSAVERNAIAIELQNIILALQDDLRAKDQEAQSLREQLNDYENWSETAQRYVLTNIGQNTEYPVHVYKLKEQFHSEEEPHHICPRCFSERKKVILQGGHQAKHNGRLRYIICPACSADFHTSLAPPQKFEPKNNTDWIV